MSTEIVDKTVEAIRRITTDAAIQKLDGADFPISGAVDCPACDGVKTLFYQYSKPRAAFAKCDTCGYKFMS